MIGCCCRKSYNNQISNKFVFKELAMSEPKHHASDKLKSQ